MSAPRHHPDHDLLVAFASGALESGRALVIATHIGACARCRAEAALAERVGGALLDALPPGALAPDALQKALAAIERPAPAEPVVAAQPPDWIRVPAEVAEAAARRRRWAAPGVWVAPVSRGPRGRRSYLLRVGPGMAMPLHTHQGSELILVLKGAYRDGETVHRPGDVTENDEDVTHKPEIMREGECVCLVAADAPLVALDWVGKLFQPFVGI